MMENKSSEVDNQFLATLRGKQLTSSVGVKSLEGESSKRFNQRVLKGDWKGSAVLSDYDGA